MQLPRLDTRGIAESQRSEPILLRTTRTARIDDSPSGISPPPRGGDRGRRRGHAFISTAIEMCAILISMVSEMNAKALKALADPTRAHIVEFLARQCCGTAAVREDGGVEGPTAGEVCCHITGADRITSTVSHHLHDLEEAGLIQMERRGKTMVCSLRPETLNDLAAYLLSLTQGANENDCCC